MNTSSGRRRESSEYREHPRGESACPACLTDNRPVNLELSVLLGVVFGGLAAACAYFISYHEYKRNWNFRGSPSKMALRSAAVAFAFFFVAAIALGFAFQMVA
jgi:hypothetical protein